MNDKQLYKPFPSNKGNSKYSVYVMKNGKIRLIHFGNKKYEHFHDKIGYYSKLNHGDKKRRDNYRKRHKAILKKDGKPAYLDKNQPSYWAYNYLW